MKTIVAGLTFAILGASFATAQDASEKKSAPKDAEQADARGGYPDLVKGLKETPGCIGVETARTQSGKNVIFAWFKDKKSALSWYNSDMHKGLMEGMGEGHSRGMRHVEDDGKPILVVASITMSKDQKIEGFPLPISQVSVEMYQPLPGGVSVNGSFAPKELVVPLMKRYDIDGKEEKPEPSRADEAKPKDAPK